MRQVRMAALARVFGWIGLTSIGVGHAAYFHEALVVRRRWVTHEEFPPGDPPEPAPPRAHHLKPVRLPWERLRGRPWAVVAVLAAGGA